MATGLDNQIKHTGCFANLDDLRNSTGQKVHDVQNNLFVFYVFETELIN